MDLTKYIRDVPDFPKPGILFKDITPLLGDQQAFKECIEHFVQRYKSMKLDKVVGIEARGFIFAGALAFALGIGMVPIRKPGKLPYHTISETYELEYGTDAMEMHNDAIQHGEKILLFDDLLATGGTLAAASRLIEKLGGEIVEIATLIELTFLNGREKISSYPYYTVMRF
ncbi:adenine phosphoribosyltransferase [Candidatus Sumerlaeota bacterium]|nr:adenine phosphoribosyltransferase [Candidatus Sumerlaeota bacterium]